ncbi:MAG: hypothetical protein KF889_19860 [Alphaproteobacteria bacterium]|nr:hypothetical protein [Alphaproteobacteria bacterium]MCW5744296.1 hypothetical protein [Alphaproteobacteria bacterium]
MLNLVKIVAALLGCLVVADIVGVIACVVIDVAPLRFKSAPLPYVIWFVLGVFTGLFAYGAAGAWTAPDADREWTEQPGAARRGMLIVAIGALVLIALGFLFHALFWSRGVAGEYFVPDSAPHTIVFFASVGASMLLFHRLLMPAART